MSELFLYRLSRLQAQAVAPVGRLCQARYGLSRREWRLIVVLARGAKPVIEAIGLPLDEDLPDFLDEAAEDVLKAIGRLKGRDAKDEAAIREAARLAARRAAQRWSGKKPQVRVVMPGAAA